MVGCPRTKTSTAACEQDDVTLQRQTAQKIRMPWTVAEGSRFDGHCPPPSEAEARRVYLQTYWTYERVKKLESQLDQWGVDTPDILKTIVTHGRELSRLLFTGWGEQDSATPTVLTKQRKTMNAATPKKNTLKSPSQRKPETGIAKGSIRHVLLNEPFASPSPDTAISIVSLVTTDA